jgi:hypothetical protein
VDIALKILKVLLLFVAGIGIGVPLYALPATLSLPAGRRSGLGPMTIKQAAGQLRATGQTGWELVESARALVGERMAYSRRNSFDPAPKAFERGYGYCQQMAYTLLTLLHELDFEAKVVQTFKAQFPDGHVTPHAWVSVTINGETRYVDPYFWDAEAGELGFTIVGKVTGYSTLWRWFAGWGCTGENARRYYKSGVDLETERR